MNDDNELKRSGSDSGLYYSECKCNKEYRGSNCSEGICVFGLDPFDKPPTGNSITYPTIEFKALNEMSNSFSATFPIKINGNNSRIEITQDSTCETLKTFFRSIDFFTNNEIDCTGGDPLPTSANSAITLTFKSSCSEDLDESDSTTNNNIEMTINKGDIKCSECSNKGICDRSTRKCKCEKYYSSSGGYSPSKDKIVIGKRGDCSYYDSYRMPVDKEEEEI